MKKIIAGLLAVITVSLMIIPSAMASATEPQSTPGIPLQVTTTPGSFATDGMGNIVDGMDTTQPVIPARVGQPRIFLGDKEFEFRGARPFYEGNVLMVPLMSGLFQRMGLKVSYDWIGREAIVATQRLILTIEVGHESVFNHGARAGLGGTVALIRGGVVYLPVEVFVRLVGWQISYNRDTKDAHIAR